MNTEYLMIEKEDGNHVMPHKPKPLCSCFIGDKMVDMYARFNFDENARTTTNENTILKKTSKEQHVLDTDFENIK